MLKTTNRFSIRLIVLDDVGIDRSKFKPNLDKYYSKFNIEDGVTLTGNDCNAP